MKLPRNIQGTNSLNFYRLGDGVLLRQWPCGRDAARSVLSKPKEFQNTILWEYLKVCDEKSIDLNLLNAICHKQGENKQWSKPLDSEIVIHLRMGDTKRFGGNNLSREVEKLYHRVATIQQEFTYITLLTLVTYYHYRIESKDATLETNADAFYSTKKALSKIGLPIEIRSSASADEDFYYLINARHLITTRGNFSLLAALCNKNFEPKNFLGSVDEKAHYDFNFAHPTTPRPVNTFFK